MNRPGMNAREGQPQPEARQEATMNDLIRMLLEDRQSVNIRLQEVQRQIAEDASRRDDTFRVQLDVLSGLVKGVHLQGEAAKKRAKASEVQLAKLEASDDIEAYLKVFEKVMSTHETPQEQWALRLAPLLTGKAQLAYAALTLDDSSNYELVKQAILKRYDITEEAYRRRFRAIMKKTDESYQEFRSSLEDLGQKWVTSAGCNTVEALREVLVREQFINQLPEETRVWVLEHKPDTSLRAAELADDYAQARLDVRQTSTKSQPPRRRTCFVCGKSGHIASECRSRESKLPEKSETTPIEGDKPTVTKGGDKPTSSTRRKDITCYNCNQKGHYSAQCPARALLCTERRVDYTGKATCTQSKGNQRPGVLRSGTIEGVKVEDILLDTGCSRTLVHEDYVPEGKYLAGEVVAIRCAHGDTVSYPLSQIDIVVDSITIQVEAAVSSTLPVSVLLGTDVPQLPSLLHILQQQPESSTAEAMVVTRARDRRQQAEERERQAKEASSGVNPSPLVDQTDTGDSTDSQDEGNPFATFDNDMFPPPQAERPRLTRSEKRKARQDFDRQQQQDKHPLDITLPELRNLQDQDESIRKLATAPDDRFFRSQEGLLYRQWLPKGDDSMVEQLVLPTDLRGEVLKLAHTIPLGGHLGKRKTADRILRRFYWPTLFRDVQRYCRSCATCQKTSSTRGRKAPLMPLPVIEEPFQRMAMDIVGPLPKSRTGKRFVLVICDYATRWPEAIPMKSIDAEHVAEELVGIFSRVGIPREILTDQGTNFTSQLLTELYRLLHVRPIKTTPYHPQTDGLVERFNQTLKAMLRRATKQEGKDWDKLIPYLLFAYREVPQASTGFSPFELVYGRHARGPLDILRESWIAEKGSKESVVSHIICVRERMEEMMKMVANNLTSAQQTQKTWYDKGARLKVFNPGDQVLVLLPTESSKLLAQWQGPYEVVKQQGPVDYIVNMHDRRKKNRTFHVNMLRQFHSSNYIDAEDEADEEDITLWPGKPPQVREPAIIADGLSGGQREGMLHTLGLFSQVLTSVPGRTELMEHTIATGSSTPIRLPPYRLPHAYKDQVQSQIEEMLSSGTIEPSSSAWSSPMVIVKKKDGSLRICVDYRRLNQLSKADAYPMPRIDDLLDQIGQAQFISTIDLAKGYWQVPVAVDDRPKTAFSTPFGLFQFNVMPFGLQGAPASFQRLMDKVITGLTFASCYLDDLIIYSYSWTHHLQHVHEVLSRLAEAGLTANVKKCRFGMSSCVYLGHVVGGGSVRPEPSKVLAVANFPRPTSIKIVRAFLGLAGYYRRFIPNYASIAAPLSDLTRKQGNHHKFEWTDECQAAFEMLKNTLSSTPVLRNPDFNRTFILQTDASNRGIGAVLSQVDETGVEHPIAFFSKKLLPREERYSTVEKECLAIKLGVQAFRVYLLGRSFVVQTDHRALVWMDRLKDTNPRLTRWSLALQPYSFTVEHKKGTANSNADGLSRAFEDSLIQQQWATGEGEGSVMDP